MNKQLPTAMELYFEGSYLCSFHGADLIRMKDTYYVVAGKEIWPASDKELEVLFF